MSLLDRIRQDAITARKARDPKAGVLVTLIGEADTAMKAMKAPRPLEDGEVLAIVRKFIKNARDTLRAVAANGGTREAAQRLETEIAALEAYVPTQMSAEELAAFARAAAEDGDNLGQIMARLKAEKAGQYDGRLAAAIVKDALAA